MPANPAEAKNRTRRRLRFGLRTLFLVMTLIGVGLGIWLGHLARQREAIAAIRRAGGAVIYDFQEAEAHPRWLRDLVGEDCLTTEKLWVNLSASHVGEETFEHLKSLRQVDTLHLYGATLSDWELEILGSMRGLRTLNLSRTNINDAGLTQIAKLTELRECDLHGTRVTESGVQQLKQALPKCSIHHYVEPLPPVEQPQNQKPMGGGYF